MVQSGQEKGCERACEKRPLSTLSTPNQEYEGKDEGEDVGVERERRKTRDRTR